MSGWKKWRWGRGAGVRRRQTAATAASLLSRSEQAVGGVPGGREGGVKGARGCAADPQPRLPLPCLTTPRRLSGCGRRKCFMPGGAVRVGSEPTAAKEVCQELCVATECGVLSGQPAWSQGDRASLAAVLRTRELPPVGALGRINSASVRPAGSRPFRQASANHLPRRRKVPF